MNKTWIWVGIVVVVLAIAGIWWYVERTSAPEMGNQQVGEAVDMTASSSEPSAAAAEANIQANGNSDAALDQDLSDITSQLNTLSTDAQAAATTSAQ